MTPTDDSAASAWPSPSRRSASPRDGQEERPDGQPQHFSITRYLRLRRYRDTLFPASLFADPAWDILLDLLAAERGGQSVSITSACVASGAPATTALRHIAKLEKHGLVLRERDHDDGRRAFLILSKEGRELLIHWEMIARTAKGIRPIRRHDPMP